MFSFFSKPFGLDIADCSIELIFLSGPCKSPKLLAMGSAVLEEGIIKEGRILEKAALKEILSSLLGRLQFGRLKTRKVVFSLPESKTFVHVLRRPPKLKKEEIAPFIKAQARETFPFTPEELYFDYIFQDGSILLAAAPKEIVNQYLELFENCSLRALALEPSSVSLGRALTSDQPEIVLIVDIGSKITNFSLFFKTNLVLSTSLPIAGNVFDSALSQKLGVPLEKAEALKKEIGFNPNFEKGRVFLILQKEIQPILEEIASIRQYCLEKKERDVQSILVGGGSSATPHLLDYLKENVEIPLALFDPWATINIDMLKKPEYYGQAQQINPALYSTALGSALRGLLKSPAEAGINLLKPKGRLLPKIV